MQKYKILFCQTQPYDNSFYLSNNALFLNSAPGYIIVTYIKQRCYFIKIKFIPSKLNQ